MTTATGDLPDTHPNIKPPLKNTHVFMRASDIRDLIAQKYAAPTHSTFFEVADATGARHTGWADAITMSLWPSHGLHIEGFEIKVSKYDWKKELANPQRLKSSPLDVTNGGSSPVQA